MMSTFITWLEGVSPASVLLFTFSFTSTYKYADIDSINQY